jgi:hypothetical protein
MGWLIRFFLFAVVFYFIYKTVSAFLRGLFGTDDRKEQVRHSTHRPGTGDLNIDYMPDDMRNRQGRNNAAGEYVDYEEIKTDKKSRKV